MNLNKGRIAILDMGKWEEVKSYSRSECDITDYFAWGAYACLKTPVRVSLFSLKEKIKVGGQILSFAYLVTVSIPQENAEESKVKECIAHQENLLYPTDLGLVPAKFLGEHSDQENRTLYFIISDKSLIPHLIRKTSVSAVSFN